MRLPRRLLIGLALPFAAGLLACPNEDDLTDPFAPMDLVIQVAPTQVQLLVSDTVTSSNNTQLQLRATSLGFPVLTPHARWTTSNSNVALVDSSGRVQALRVGVATITARVNGETTNSVVTVANAVVGVTLLPSTASGAVGDSTTLTASAVGTNGLLVGGTAYAFTLTDPTVASLTRTGNQTVNLRFLKVGTTQVTVLAGGHTAASTITVH
jgi:uncharacterized protein YjdB